MFIEVNEEQLETLRGLLAEKIDSDYEYYSILHPIYQSLAEVQ